MYPENRLVLFYWIGYHLECRKGFVMAQQFYYLLYREYGKSKKERICAYNVSDAIVQAKAKKYQASVSIVWVETPSGKRVLG